MIDVSILVSRSFGATHLVLSSCGNTRWDSPKRPHRKSEVEQVFYLHEVKYYKGLLYPPTTPSFFDIYVF